MQTAIRLKSILGRSVGWAVMPNIFIRLIGSCKNMGFLKMRKFSLSKLDAGHYCSTCALKNIVFKVVLVFGGGSAFYSTATIAGDVPPIIGPWAYWVARCDQTIGPFNDENTAALAGIAENYTGPNWKLDQNPGDVWGTQENPQPGSCGSDNYYPQYPWNYTMGYENYNVRHQTVIHCDANNNCYRDGLGIYRGRTIYCPAGTAQNGNLCSEQYILVRPNDDQSPPKNCAGNPMDIATGSKIQQEIDVDNVSMGGVSFVRTYSNANTATPATWGWHHNYQKSLQVIDPSVVTNIKNKSAAYDTKQDACTSGWNDIKNQISASWASGATAQLEGETCNIVKNGKIVRNLPITNTASLSSEIVPGAIRLLRDDGSVVSYQYYGGSNWRSLNGEQGQLQKLLAPSAGWRFTTQNGFTEDYNTAGQLIAVANATGQAQTLSYDADGNVKLVTDTKGHQLAFNYSPDKKLSNVVFDSVKITSFGYAANGLIGTVTHPDNKTRQYHYEDPNFPSALTGITDERGIRFATWQYDTQGRAISSEHAGGAEKTTLAFNADGSTTVTNVLGKKTTYLFDDILGVKRVSKVTGEPTASCVGANQNYTYNSQGYVETKTDWKGNVTKFAYDNYGRETSRTQAFGTPEATTIQTCWHPTLNQPSRLIEPSKITLYDYWPNGQIKSQLIKPRPAGAVDCATAL